MLPHEKEQQEQQKEQKEQEQQEQQQQQPMRMIHRRFQTKPKLDYFGAVKRNNR
jgi:hypothetical protein